MTKVGEFKLNKVNSFIINLISLLIFISSITILFKIYNLNLYDVYFDYFLNSSFLFSIVFLLIVIVVLHELIHGIGYKIFGAKLKFGFKYLNIYTIDTSGNTYGIVEMFIIMFLPLLSLTIFLVLLSFIFNNNYHYFIFCIIFNISSSIGDIILFIYMLAKGGGCKIKDTNYGFLVYKKL